MTPELAMLTEKFDAYGEVLPDGARNKRDAAAPVVLGRIGQCVFWLLVIIIVSTRVLYYPAVPAFELGGASDAKHAVLR
jgi:hypothetical protein